MIPAIFKYFDCSDLSKHEYFKGKKVPEWLKGAQLHKISKVKTIIGNVHEPLSFEGYLEGENNVFSNVNLSRG